MAPSASSARSAQPPSTIEIAGWAEVAGVARIDDRDALSAIASKVIWTDDYAASRLQWKQRDPLWVLALRAHRLLEPISIPFEERYAGCASWVDLDGLPDDPTSVPSEPALTDESFAARLKLCAQALPGGFAEAAQAGR